MLGLINGILGAALLLAGRRLFWLFIGTLGFITGIQLTVAFWQGPDWLLLVIGVIIGIVFATLAVFLQSLAIGVAGFLSGGYVLTALTEMLGISANLPAWILFIIGGLIGIVLVGFLFDWAIIALSSLAGTSLLIRTFFPQSGSAQLIFIILFLFGVIVQGSLLRSEKGRISSKDTE